MMLQQLQGKTRKISILRIGYSMNGIFDILQNTMEPVRYSNFHKKSQIHFKKVFIKYVNFCLEKKLIYNKKVYGTRIHRPIQSWFVITEKGRTFLEMLS